VIQQQDINSNVSALMAMATGADVAHKGVNDVYQHFTKAGLMSEDGGSGPSRPFAQVEAVNACVNFTASAIASMAFRVGTDRDKLIESGPIFDLIDQPNDDQDGGEFWYDTVAWLLLTGRVHWVYTEMAGSRPLKIMPVAGPLMKPVYEGGTQINSGPIIGWLWRQPGMRWDSAQPVALEQQRRIMLKGFNPDRPDESLSIIQVVQRKINQIFKADTANERSLDNDMQPGAIISPEQPVTDEQWRGFMDQLREQGQGYGKRHRMLATSQKVNVSRLQATFSEMEFPEMLARSVASVCVGFGFDPAVLGYPPEGGRYEYIKQSKASAWIDRLLPLAATLAGHFDRGPLSAYEGDRSLTFADQKRSMRTRAISPRVASSYGFKRAMAGSGELFAWFDDSSVPAVREAKLALAKEGEILIKTYKCPPADVMELYDLGLPIHPHQREAWQVLNEMPISAAAEPGGDEDKPVVTEDDKVEVVDDEPMTEEEIVEATYRRLEITQEQIAGVYRAWLMSFRGIERKMRVVLGSHFKRLRREVLENINRLDPTKGYGAGGETFDYPMRWFDVDGNRHQRVFRLPVTSRSIIGSMLFDLVEADGRLLAKMRPLVRLAVQTGGEQTMTEAAAATGKENPDPFNIADPKAVELLKNRDVRTTSIDKRDQDRLRATLSEGLEKGESYAELRERVKSHFNVSERKAGLIAFQETSSAVEESRSIARDQAKVPLKSWLWSQKVTGRDDHRALEAATMASPIPRDADFDVAGEKAQFPRDSRLSAKQSINCGCTTLSRYPGDNIKAIVDRLLTRGFVETTLTKDAS